MIRAISILSLATLGTFVGGCAQSGAVQVKPEVAAEADVSAKLVDLTQRAEKAESSLVKMQAQLAEVTVSVHKDEQSSQNALVAVKADGGVLPLLIFALATAALIFSYGVYRIGHWHGRRAEKKATLHPLMAGAKEYAHV